MPDAPVSGRGCTTSSATVSQTTHSCNQMLLNSGPVSRSGGDQNLFFLEFVSPTTFDNSYFNNITALKSLLNSDQVLLTKNEASMELVKKYAENQEDFFEQFAKSIVKMGNISPLTGYKERSGRIAGRLTVKYEVHEECHTIC